MELEIEDRRLKELDKKIFDFYKEVQIHGESRSFYSIEKLQKAINKLEKEADKFRPKSEFDKLVYQNIKFILSTVKTNCNFHSELDFSVKDWVNANYGNFAWSTLEKEVKGYDFNLSLELDKLREEISGSYIHAASETAKKRMESDYMLIKEEVLNYIKANGILPKDFNFETDFIMEENSGWNLDLKRLSLSVNHFLYYIEKNELKLNPSELCRILFHEIAGHAANQIYSVELPLSLTFSKGGATIKTTSVIYEGIAKEKERLNLAFLELNAKKFGLNEKEIKLAELYLKNSRQNYAWNAYTELLALKKIREPSFNIEKKLNMILRGTISEVGIREHVRSIEHMKMPPQSLPYVLGPCHIEKVKKNLGKKFGKSLIDANKAKVNRALATGEWTWKVYPKFVEWYVQRLQCEENLV